MLSGLMSEFNLRDIWTTGQRYMGLCPDFNLRDSWIMLSGLMSGEILSGF